MDRNESTDADLRRYEHATSWLVQLREDDLTHEQIMDWLQWCDAQRDNREAFERLLPLWRALDDPQFAERLAVLDMARGGALRPRRGSRFAIAAVRWSRRARAMRKRAPIRLIIAFAAFAVGFGSWRLGERAPAVLVAQLTTPIARNLLTTLPDGSRVTLGALSTLTVDFRDGQRHVDLARGEAFFSVKHNARHPFVVQAGALQVQDLGTAFDVLHTAKRVVVTVKRGLVEVTDDSAPVGASESLHVPAGYQVIWAPGQDMPLRLRTVDPAVVAAWRNGLLEFVATPLSVVIADINRYSTTPVVLSDGLASLRYTGTIQVHDIDEWLQALPRIFPVVVHTGHDRAMLIEAAQTPSMPN